MKLLGTNLVDSLQLVDLRQELRWQLLSKLVGKQPVIDRIDFLGDFGPAPRH